MLNKHSGSQMTVQPQKRRAIQISNTWTKPAEARLSTPSNQMESQKPISCLQGNSLVFFYLEQQPQHAIKQITSNSEMSISLYDQMRRTWRSTNKQRSAKGANRRQ